MVSPSHRLDKIIARRRFAEPTDRARHLKKLRHQLDGLNELLPTTETPYKRTRFTYDPYPIFRDITASTNEILNENSKVTFGTITEYPINNRPPVHPAGRNFPRYDYHDWNRHAPTLLEFCDFVNLPGDNDHKLAVVTEYWENRYRASPTDAQWEVQQAIIRGQQQAVDPPVQDNEVDEDTTTVEEPAYAQEHPSDEDTTDNSTSGTSTEREHRFNQYVPGPTVSCVVSPHFPAQRRILAGTYGSTTFTHLDTSGNQFTILPDTPYHFNDTTVWLNEDRTGLVILAICPETVDVTNVPDTTNEPTELPTPPVQPKEEDSSTTTNNTTDTTEEPTSPTTPRYPTRNNTRTTSYDDYSCGTPASDTTDDTPRHPGAYYDPDYALSDEDPSDEELVVDTNDSGTEYEDDSTTNSTSKALVNLAVSDTIDLTQSDTDEDSTDEAGDVIVLYTINTSTELI